MAISLSDWVFGTGFVVSTTGLIITLMKWKIEIAEKREHKTRAENAEKTLAENRRRAEGPLLHATHLIFESWQVPPPEMISDQLPEGSRLALHFANSKSEVYEVWDDWADGVGMTCFQRILRTDQDSGKIVYIYKQEMRGKVMKMRLSFTSPTGEKMHHVYEIVHGRCDLRRIDPE